MPGNIPFPSPAVVASWPKPNYVDPVQRTWLPPYAMVLQSVASFLVGLRLVLRTSKHGGGLGLDDALLIPAWLTSIAFTIVAVVASDEGLADRHIWDLKPARYPEMALNVWIAELLFLLGTPCAKISVLLFYRRLLRGSVSRALRMAIWAAVIFTVLWTTGLVLALFLTCRPTRAYWKAYELSWKHEYRCTDTKWLNPLTGILCMASDIYAAALPWLMLRPLQIARRQKLQLNLLFGLGLVVAAVSVGRTWVMVKFGTDSDSTCNLHKVGFEVYAFSLLEYELGIIVACLPALRALVKHMSERGRLRGSEGTSQSIGSSPESKTSMWEGDEAFLYGGAGGRNKVVIIGDYADG